MVEEKTLNPELEELKKQINVLKGKVSTLDAKKKEIKKEAEESIGKAIYEKKKEIERSYSEVLKEAEQRLKSKEKEKEDERKKNINRIVDENTKEIKEDNTYLKNHIKNILNENKIPGFVNSDFYMGIWCPSTIKEWIIGILTVIIVLLIPTIIVFVVSNDNLIVAFPNVVLRNIIIALIYFGVIFIFGIIWLVVDKLTKKNDNVIKDIKELRKNVEDNLKKIKKITQDTFKEMTDDKFDYTKIDREIEAGKIEVEKYKKKKEDAINHFENDTINKIREKAKAEIAKRTKPIDKEIEQVKSEIDSMQKKYDELRLSLVG